MQKMSRLTHDRMLALYAVFRGRTKKEWIVGQAQDE